MSPPAGTPPGPAPAPAPPTETPRRPAQAPSWASRGAVPLVFLALCVGLALAAATHVERAGPYYDEAFMGQQAKDFFEPERGLHHPGSTREITLFGRPFPLRNAVYLGATKSQLLIPAFALFGPTLATMRLATLALCLAALGLTMAWARRVLGPRAAVWTGILLAVDPAFYWFGLYEWGPYSVLLLCRAAALWLLTRAWSEGRPGAAALGGLCLGLGVFTRADFVVVAAAGVAAAAVVWPGAVREALGPRRGVLVGALVGGALGAAPMLLSLPDLLATSGSPVIGSRGGLDEKLRVYTSLLDGSRFLRVLAAGGMFREAWARPAPAGLFGPAVGAAFAGWIALAVLARRRFGRPRRGGSGGSGGSGGPGGPGAADEPGERGAPEQPGAPDEAGRSRPALRPLGFLALASVGIVVGMLAIPGAVRAHHLLNVLPLWHGLVAGVAVAWVDGAPAARGRRARAAAATLALLVVAGSQVRMDVETWQLLERTGGRGRWTEAIREPARRLEADPSLRGVSLDWGLHEPLLFLTHRARLVEAFWDVRAEARRPGGWRFAGGAGDVYLAHADRYDLFGLSRPFLAAVERLERRAPGTTAVREHASDDGDLAFRTVRIAADHELVVRRGAFRIELAGEASGGGRGTAR